jgi:4'-phosphopantetheinyl transferase
MRSVLPAVAVGLNRDMKVISTSLSSAINNPLGWLTTEDPEKILPDNAVHVWRVPLDQSSERTAAASKVLSPDEREVTARYHFNMHRQQFVQARAGLRLVLSDYTGVDPRNLEFTYGPQGKPALTNAKSHGDLRFNLSRRDGLALIAVTRGREIGIDVELLRKDLPFFEIAEASFSAAESAALRNLPESALSRGFYNCWTRKEAFVKAIGQGLSFPLKDFDVSLRPGDAAELLEARGSHTNDAARWSLHDISVSENYVAALTVEGSGVKVTDCVWDWAAFVTLD